MTRALRGRALAALTTFALVLWTASPAVAAGHRAAAAARFRPGPTPALAGALSLPVMPRLLDIGAAGVGPFSAPSPAAKPSALPGSAKGQPLAARPSLLAVQAGLPAPAAMAVPASEPPSRPAAVFAARHASPEVRRAERSPGAQPTSLRASAAGAARKRDWGALFDNARSAAEAARTAPPGEDSGRLYLSHADAVVAPDEVLRWSFLFLRLASPEDKAGTGVLVEDAGSPQARTTILPGAHVEPKPTHPTLLISQGSDRIIRLSPLDGPQPAEEAWREISGRVEFSSGEEAARSAGFLYRAWDRATGALIDILKGEGGARAGRSASPASCEHGGE